MDQHPIPQNVTTFQFRLIGDMTIKQFSYLLGGAILGYISYKLPLPFFFSWPMAILFVLGGIGFAFVPVEDRPMDVWVLSFFRNVYSPTLFVWEKTKQTTLPQGTKQTTPPPTVSPPGVTKAIQPPAPGAQTIAAPQGAHVAHLQAPSTATILSSVLLPKGDVLKPAPLHAVATPVAVPQVAQKTQKTATPPSSPRHAPGFIEKLFQFFSMSEKHANPKTPPVSISQTRMVSRVPKKTHADDAFALHAPADSSRGPFAWLLDLFKSPPRPTSAPNTYSQGALFSATPVTSVTGTHIDLPQKEDRANPPAGGPAPVPPQDTRIAKELEEKIGKLEGELKTKEASDARVLELQKQLMDAMSQTARNQAELTRLRQQMQVHPVPQVFRPAGVVQPMPSGNSTTVRVVPQESARRIGLPTMTTVQNVITGVVKDEANNLLPNVLITVRDKEDVPLRALKSNKLGQFAASTPLSDGTYVIEVEDPRGHNTFDRVQISLNSNILPAIEIIAKNQKRINREKLAQQVFGTQA